MSIKYNSNNAEIIEQTNGPAGTIATESYSRCDWHRHNHYREESFHHCKHQVVRTTEVHQSSSNTFNSEVQEKVIRSRLQLGYSTPAAFINKRFSQKKLDRIGSSSEKFNPHYEVYANSAMASSSQLGRSAAAAQHHQHQPALSSSYVTGQHIYSQNYLHTSYPSSMSNYHHSQQMQLAHQHYQHSQHQSHLPQGYRMMALHQPQNYGTVIQAYDGKSYQTVSQIHKKPGIKNGDVMKRCRLQAAYELSQDLLDKQIEMLERKYGGVRARNAALTIQRAFRRHTLLKKFAAITAMAKAEKRLSRKLHEMSDCQDQDKDPGHQMNQNYAQQQTQSQVLTGRPTPNRSMSLREKRQGAVVDGSQPPMARVLVGRCDIHVSPNMGINHAAHQSMNHMVYTSGKHSVSITPTSCGRQQQQHSPASPCWESSSQERGSSLHYYNPQESLCGIRQETPSRDFYRTPSTVPLMSLNSQTPSPQNWSSSSQLSSGGRSGSMSSVKRVPPEVPKRTSSISSRSMEGRYNGLSKSVENGSLSSVQSSESDSTNCESYEGDGQRESPVWKHKANSSSPELREIVHVPDENRSIPHNVKDLSHASSTYQLPLIDHQTESIGQVSCKISETVRKRQYRVGLNLFNKKPERGINYLMRRGFLENSSQGVARFLISRKGLSKQMIGEYLGNLQSPFNMAVLECFAHELDLAGMQVDVALRKFQAYFRMPGEAQKIERLMEVFSQRYCQCNPEIVSRLRSPDTIFVLAFAIIMLNTDLHTPNLKPERRMKPDDFVKNLRGIDDCGDIDRDILVGIYERVKSNEFKPGSDHVTQVMKVQATIVGKKPNMALPHRRLVCYCRLYEIPDINKKERPGVHQREVFLFNDLLVVTKILSKKKNSVTYTFRQSFPLCGMSVTLFEAPHYLYGIRLGQRVDGKVLVTFNARNEHDRCKFIEDLRESISEMDEMETLRIEMELERQKSNRGTRGSSENRDSGVADVEVCPCPGSCLDRSEIVDSEMQMKRSALSNSLLDIHEQFTGEKPQRRGSVGSLDSGMSISFQSTSASSMSQGVKHPNQYVMGNAASGASRTAVFHHQASILGGFLNKRERKLSHTEVESSPFSRTTEV